MDVHDLQYCFHYLQTKDPNKVYILNTNGVSCGVIRAVRIAPGDLPTTEQFERAMREDPSQIQIPFLVKIFIMPLRFQEFWQLIWTRKVPSQDQSSQHAFYKWKLAFDSYREALPAYYNDYFNQYFKYLQVPNTPTNSIYGAPSERTLFEQNPHLA